MSVLKANNKDTLTLYTSEKESNPAWLGIYLQGAYHLSREKKKKI